MCMSWQEYKHVNNFEFFRSILAQQIFDEQGKIDIKNIASQKKYQFCYQWYD